MNFYLKALFGVPWVSTLTRAELTLPKHGHEYMPMVPVGRFAVALLFAIAIVVNSSLARADSTPPKSASTKSTASQPPPSAAEQIKIPARSSSPASGETSNPVQFNNPLTFSRMAFALIVVLGAIFVLRWAVKKIPGISAGTNMGNAVQILSKSMVSPKQQLMLIQIGKRVLLVANCGAQMSTLCEIDDAEEITQIIGQLQRPVISPAKSFMSLFGKAGRGYGDEVEGDPAISDEENSPPIPAEEQQELLATRNELGGLLERVRAISRGGRQL